MQHDIYEGKVITQQEDERAAQCAAAQAAIDLAEKAVIEAHVSSKTNPLAPTHMHLQCPHWYVRVAMHHKSGGSETHALYRVWSSEGAWKATHVGQILPKRERYH
ncbi:hypothetical protein KSF_094360 [Reticulibacter mediterranei]|uniref:Uncharacterized protein n=1 Tax=Reticulibacter mediterranei TaxID=2778369 RepID=A0A8J3IVM7_9CHLR|nr:hypothetical protein [Reticulibacter mediterranei]GHO99388.1 hypothetical protein KSF_094360 [Reticulibacter mediterranei]